MARRYESRKGKAVDRARLKARLIDELLKLLADRTSNPDSNLDLNRSKRFNRIVSLIEKMQSRRARQNGIASNGRTRSS